MVVGVLVHNRRSASEKIQISLAMQVLPLRISIYDGQILSGFCSNIHWRRSLMRKQLAKYCSVRGSDVSRWFFFLMCLHAVPAIVVAAPAPVPEPALLLLPALGANAAGKNPDSSTQPVAVHVADALAADMATTFLADSSLNMLLRNYYGYFDSAANRTAWIQGARVYFESGYTQGPVGVGIGVAPFLAVKLNGGRGAGNMVHVGPGLDAPNERTWAYLGEYAVKAKFFGLQLRYGLQTLINPFLKPYDNRSLPPTFRGLSLSQVLTESVALKGGSFDAVNARGADRLTPLTTSYGTIGVGRLSYAGVEWTRPAGTRVALYASTAQDLWNQYYVSLPSGLGATGAVQWSGKVDAYLTKATGQHLQGEIDNRAMSAAITGKLGASSITLAYQRIVGNEFFDFVQETSGIYLANAMGNDFNAPHERSIQLRYKFDGGPAVPGFTVMAWAIAGWGADGTAGAKHYADKGSLLHKLYWKNGAPIGGTHQEYALNPSYTFQSGAMKATRISLVLTLHDISPNYPSRAYLDWRLMADVPFKFF